VPALGGVVWRLGTLALILGGLAFVNARGVRSGARTIEVMTAAKLVPLLLFVAVGAFAIQPSFLAWPGLPGADALGRASLMLIFAFMGIEVALAPSGEVRDPARTVPRSIYLALAVTTVLYIAIQLVAQGVLGPALADQTRAPLAEATSRFMGSAGRSLILLGAMCSMFGYVSGDMLSSPRNLYAFARAGVLPAIFARVHPTRQTPHVAIWAHAVLVFVLASTNSFEHLLVVSNVAGLALYLMGCAAAMELTRRNVQGAGVPFVIPGTHVVPILAGVVILLIMSSATVKELMVTAGTLVVASTLYLVPKA
jgi:basic amino acid/polyamine antiporter, APA family